MTAKSDSARLLTAEGEGLVSVVMPAYNASAFIFEAIQSALAQSHRNLELLVVDDGSSDDTVEVVLREAAGDDRIQLLRNGFKKGPAGARNTAIEQARGRYIAFLDSDDVWYPEKIRVQLELIADTGAPLVFSAFDLMDESGRSTGQVRSAPARISYEQLLRRNVIGCLTAMFDTQKAGKPFMPDIAMRQDWGLWLRILRETGEFAVSSSASLASLRLRSGSLSRGKLRATWYNYQLLRKHEGLGWPQAASSVAAHALWSLRSTRRKPQ